MNREELLCSLKIVNWVLKYEILVCNRFARKGTNNSLVQFNYVYWSLYLMSLVQCYAAIVLWGKIVVFLRSTTGL
jgi:hypothetical protein